MVMCASANVYLCLHARLFPLCVCVCVRLTIFEPIVYARNRLILVLLAGRMQNLFCTFSLFHVYAIVRA